MVWNCLIVIQENDVAKSGKQCIYMVVGKPRQDKAVKMAGTKPPRYASRRAEIVS